MASPQPSPSRRRTYDYTHQPEQGLQEWASRIKSIQAEVDRDEEAEQKRLEEEIAASRLARAQRRGGKQRLSDVPQPTPTLDPAPPKTAPESPTRATFGSLRKSIPNTSPTRSDPELAPESPTKPTFGSTRTAVFNPSGPKLGAPVSLAAFIGGKATGPRLNKPAPQVDSHDPTLFDQTPHRSGPTAAAAAFQSSSGRGRGAKFGQGVALPGLGLSGTGVGTSGRDSLPSTPVMEKPAFRSPRATAPSEHLPLIEHKRTRTISSPDKVTSPIPVPGSRTDSFRGNTFGRPRTKSTTTPSPTPPSPPKGLGTSPTLAPAFSTPPQRARSKSNTTPLGSPFSAGTSPTLGLARAIQPSPPAQDSNKLPLSASASPAFRSTQQASSKELSPSLTRLQGRGFVGNRVRQAAADAFPAASQFGEREKEKPKRGVQDRWQQAVQSSPSPSSSVDVPAWKKRMTGSATFPSPSAGEKTPSRSGSTGRGPLGVQMPVNSSPTSVASPTDVFGRRPSTTPVKAAPEPVVQKTASAVSGDPKSSIQAKPLSHLTKDRARKPKKTVHIKEDSGTTNVAPVAAPTTPVTAPTPLPEPRSPSPFKRLRPVASNPSMRSSSPTRPSETKEEPVPKSQRAGSPVRRAATIFNPMPRKDSAPTPAPTSLPWGNNVSRAKEMWAERAPIGAKPTHPSRGSSSPTPPASGPSMVGKRALPGLVSTHQSHSQSGPFARPESPVKPGPTTPKKSHFPRPESPTKPRPVSPKPHASSKPQAALASPSKQHAALPAPSKPRATTPTSPKPPAHTAPPASPKPRPHAAPPASPGRAPRMPTTGNRATVMEVAQTMIEKQDGLGGAHEKTRARLSLGPLPSASSHMGGPPSPRTVGHPSPRTAGPPSPSLRAPGPSSPSPRSDRRSPGPPSPRADTAERRRSNSERYSAIVMPALKEEKTPAPTPAGTISRSQELVAPVGTEGLPAVRKSPRAQAVGLPSAEKGYKKADGVYRVDQNMAPIPPFNLQQVLNSNPYTFTFPSNLKRISTDVFAIVDGQATAVPALPCVVYEGELVAVVQRLKNESNGLVSNKVWGWRGRKTEPGAKDEGKLVELGKQYGTNVIVCMQGEESHELVDAVGGHWITRQGTRAHWTPENTTMHCTRRVGDAHFTDEVDFHVSNLCSAYSYCITALDAVYAWHGRGATQTERESAAMYARTIAGPEKDIEEFGEGKEDPMFFMLLGEDPWANADYWKYRPQLGKAGARPRMFVVDARDKKQPVSCVVPSASKVAPNSVVVLDGVLELFVLVGSEARARRTDILLAVHVAISITAAVDARRPFTPTVHILVLPSQLPLDLKAGYFRFLSDEHVNSSKVPSHINLLTLLEASEHLSAATWPMSRLQEHDFLPLGLHPNLIN